MIIAVSDIHFGYDKCDVNAFEQFVSTYISENLTTEDHFVLLGDIFDFWRRKNIDPLLENKEVITKILDLNSNVHYIIGNHDYYMLKIKEKFLEYRTLDLRKYLRLVNNGKKYFFIHGYELDVLANYERLTLEEYERISEGLCRMDNFTGKIISKLWGIRKKLQRLPEERKSWNKGKDFIPNSINHMSTLEEFSCSKVRNFFLGMSKDENLVFGHTHNPFVNKEKDVGNTGSWVKGGTEYNTFIQIKNGRMELKKWDDGRILNLEINRC